MATKPRVVFIFTSGRRARLASREPVPSELFYGYVELVAQGWNLDLIEESDVVPYRRALSYRALARVLPEPLDISLPRLAGFVSRLGTLNQYDVVFCTNQQHGVELSVLKAAGLLRPPLVTLVMGLLPAAPPSSARAALLARILRRTTVVAISRGEEAFLRGQLGGQLDLRYAPFGVDHHFWQPTPIPSNAYVISVGNDRHRDFELLMRIWRPEWPRLRVVTRLALPPSRGPIEVVAGHYNQVLITDVQMREHVQNALFSVIPVRQTAQPSGQSAALQAMAAGVPLIVSDTTGMWDRAVMRDGETCLAPRCGSDEAMVAAVERMISSAQLREQLRRAGREAIEQHLSAEIMASELGKVFRSVSAGPALREPVRDAVNA
ncbi:MAG: glycosyltransferase family 4 protein [Polyangiaceae bacterium]|nr:glycosyltransferase family 4 protein [Polyangiaceae bacterium]MBK8940570.1 glycosyltransferase family 4 protein [Polyangiaceae bacterium]